MAGLRRPRRGAAGWTVVVDRWRASGLSVDAFCQRDGVNRAGFYRWRALLSTAELAPRTALALPAVHSRAPVSNAPPAAAFVDLGT